MHTKLDPKVTIIVPEVFLTIAFVLLCLIPVGWIYTKHYKIKYQNSEEKNEAKEITDQIKKIHVIWQRVTTGLVVCCAAFTATGLCVGIYPTFAAYQQKTISNLEHGHSNPYNR